MNLFDVNFLFASLIWGSIGLGYCIYDLIRKSAEEPQQRSLSPAGSGRRFAAMSLMEMTIFRHPLSVREQLPLSGPAPLAILEFALVIGLLTGCSTSRPSAWRGSGDPPDQEQLIQIVAGDKPAQLTYCVPLEKGEAAAETARDLLKDGLGHPLAIIFAPVFAGGVAGIAAVRGVPIAERLRAEAVMTNAYHRLDLAGELCAELRCAGEQRLPGRWIIGGGTAPAGLTNTAGSPKAELRFEVDFSVVGLEPRDASEVMVNPSLRMVVAIRGSIRRTLDGEEIYFNRWEERGRRHKFTDWTKNNGRVLIEELTGCTRRVAAQAIQEMFRK